MSKSKKVALIDKVVQCGCGKSTCGVGKNHGEINAAFLKWAGDTPQSRESNRRWTYWGKLAAAGRL